MSLNVNTVSCFCIRKNHFLKNLCSGTHRGGFQFSLILDLWGIIFHAVVVIGLGKNLLFKSVLGQKKTKGSYPEQRLPQHERLYPIGLKSSRIEIPHFGTHYIDFSETDFN